MMDPAFEQAAFSLGEAVVSEPVRSRFGYHLIEVTAIEGGEPAPFEEVREQLARELGGGGAETAYFELAEQLANLTYESPDSLIPAAETLDLEVQTSDWIERSGGDGMLGNSRVTAAAFSEDVLVRGNNSELIEPDPDRMRAIVLRVDEHEPAAVRPLDEVRGEIITSLREQQAAAGALAAAEDMAGRLRAGDALEALLETAPDTATLQEPGKVTRSQAGTPPTVLDLAFAAPRPGAGAASYTAGQEPGGDAVVVAVRAVEDGDSESLDPALREAERRLLARNQAEHGFEQILDDLVIRAKIERKELSREEP
jgi:peptidyl-prolyl cis-trans isomerase D